MKTLLFASAIITLGLVGCSKEKPAPQNPQSTTAVATFQTKEGGQKYDDIACYITDGNGNSCTGQRCGSPNGSDCKKQTTCQCDQRKYGGSTIIFENYTVDQFNAMWADSLQRLQLIRRGYSEHDGQQ